jgi:hypothetical protein
MHEPRKIATKWSQETRGIRVKYKKRHKGAGSNSPINLHILEAW